MLLFDLGYLFINNKDKLHIGADTVRNYPRDLESRKPFIFIARTKPNKTLLQHISFFYHNKDNQSIGANEFSKNKETDKKRTDKLNKTLLQHISFFYHNKDNQSIGAKEFSKK